MSDPDSGENGAHRECQKPPRLVVRWRNDEVNGCADFVPDTTVVGRRDAEAVLSRREIGVESLSAVNDLLPVTIEAFELVAKSHFLRRDQAQCGVIDLQIV